MKHIKRRKLNPDERFAIWQANNGFCFYCSQYVDYPDTTIDHIIPIAMAKNPIEFQRLLRSYRLPPNFDVNACYNLLPCHHHCNRQKSDRVFLRAMMLDWLRQAKTNEKRVRACICKMQRDPWRHAAIISFETVLEQETMPKSYAARLHQIIRFLKEWEIRHRLDKNTFALYKAWAEC
jgi:5-methylcytosine-specific restriction endonuclease McrA